MSAPYRLVITPCAVERIDSLVDYLFIEWGLTVRDHFLHELTHCFDIIRRNPCAFPALSKNPLVRQCVVSRQNKVYYMIQGNDIVILSLEDTRMDPNRLKF